MPYLEESQPLPRRPTMLTNVREEAGERCVYLEYGKHQRCDKDRFPPPARWFAFVRQGNYIFLIHNQYSLYTRFLA